MKNKQINKFIATLIVRGKKGENLKRKSRFDRRSTCLFFEMIVYVVLLQKWKLSIGENDDCFASPTSSFLTLRHGFRSTCREHK
jgi:hypothetical protein